MCVFGGREGEEVLGWGWGVEMGRECAEDSTIDNIPLYTVDSFLKRFVKINLP